jgi:enolase
MENGKLIQRRLNENLGDREYTIGDEGGVVFKVRDVLEPFELLSKSMEGIEDVELGTDVAASSFFADGMYVVDGEKKTRDDMIKIYTRLFNELGLRHIEDPFEENDFEGFSKLLSELSGINIIGDDLTTTNVDRLQKAIDNKSVSSLIIKPNQIGTLTETIDTIELAHRNGVNCIVSHRSGETLDSFIADLTRAFYCYGIKSGAWGQKEREVKYERLLKIY